MRTVFAIILCIAQLKAAAADSWPQRFLRVQGTDHTLVVLYEDGRAAYSTRLTRGKGFADYYFVSSRAEWNWCDDSLDAPKRCLTVSVHGEEGREQEVSFRFSYIYESSKITPYDEGGFRDALQRISGY